MRRLSAMPLLAAIVTISVSVWSGCGQAPSGDNQAETPTTTASAGPEATVQTFLEGARTGNDEQVTSMLSTTARTELAKRELWVAPKGSDTARFVIGEVHSPTPDIAQVATRWIEVDPASGEEYPADMTWVLRKETEGWRIGGMAMAVFDGEPPLLLNFEDPDDMLHQKQQLQAEIARRREQYQAQTGVAEKPEESTQR